MHTLHKFLSTEVSQRAEKCALRMTISNFGLLLLEQAVQIAFPVIRCSFRTAVATRTLNINLSYLRGRGQLDIISKQLAGLTQNSAFSICL
jgi:hypothetical protein